MIIFFKTFIGGCFLALFMNYHPLVYRGTHVSFAECNSRTLQAVSLKSWDCAVLPQWLAGGILFSWAFSSRVALCVSGGKQSCMRFSFQPPATFLTGPPYGWGWKVRSLLGPSESSLGESPGFCPFPVGVVDKYPVLCLKTCPHCFHLPVLVTLGTGCGVTVYSFCMKWLWTAPYVKLSRIGPPVH